MEHGFIPPPAPMDALGIQREPFSALDVDRF
jgi:hypothetical protein